MTRYRMHAIEYNVMMTLLKLLTDRLPDILKEYNLGEVRIDPAYPRDLTNMIKPSIIVRRVDTNQFKIGMGNVLGQIFEDGGYSDMFGIGHEMMVQFDTVANSNSQNMILSSILCDDIFNDILINHSGRFQLYDFTKNVNDPTEMGVVTISDIPTIVYIPDGITRPNLNNDYISATRLTFTIIQEIKPKQDYVDLSKWLKINQVVKVNI